MKRPKYTPELAARLLELWDENEDNGIAEQAALYVGCDMLGIPHEDAYDVLALSRTRQPNPANQ